MHYKYQIILGNIFFIRMCKFKMGFAYTIGRSVI